MDLHTPANHQQVLQLDAVESNTVSAIANDDQTSDEVAEKTCLAKSTDAALHSQENKCPTHSETSFQKDAEHQSTQAEEEDAGRSGADTAELLGEACARRDDLSIQHDCPTLIEIQSHIDATEQQNGHLSHVSEDHEDAEPALPSRDLKPDEINTADPAHPFEEGDESILVRYDEDAIIQDSQPVYAGGPIGSSSPVDTSSGYVPFGYSNGEEDSVPEGEGEEGLAESPANLPLSKNMHEDAPLNVNDFEPQDASIEEQNRDPSTLGVSLHVDCPSEVEIQTEIPSPTHLSTTTEGVDTFSTIETSTSDDPQIAQTVRTADADRLLSENLHSVPSSVKDQEAEKTSADLRTVNICVPSLTEDSIPADIKCPARVDSATSAEESRKTRIFARHLGVEGSAGDFAGDCSGVHQAVEGSPHEDARSTDVQHSAPDKSSLAVDVTEGPANIVSTNSDLIAEDDDPSAMTVDDSEHIPTPGSGSDNPVEQDRMVDKEDPQASEAEVPDETETPLADESRTAADKTTRQTGHPDEQVSSASPVKVVEVDKQKQSDSGDPSCFPPSKSTHHESGLAMHDSEPDSGDRAEGDGPEKTEEEKEAVESDSDGPNDEEQTTVRKTVNETSMVVDPVNEIPATTTASENRQGDIAESSHDSAGPDLASTAAASKVTKDTISLLDTPSKPSTPSLAGKSTPAPTSSRLHRDSVKGQTYVGGMLASNKAMRPFRSPMIARKDGGTVHAVGTSQISTPSKVPSASGTKSILGRKPVVSASTATTDAPVSSPISSSSRTALRTSTLASAKTNTRGNVALNKPFKSLFSRQAGKARSEAESSSDDPPNMVDIDGNVMTSFQLSTSLTKLERRLALLKDAKRHRIACERGLDTADNTDHIRELSAKWLEKGREAAELLWELVKDNMEAQDSNQHGDTGFGNGFGNEKTNSNWGWDDSVQSSKGPSARRRRQGDSTWQTTNTVERLREEVSLAINELTDEGKEALYDELEKEGSLPELDPEMIIERTCGKRSSTSLLNRANKRSRLASPKTGGTQHELDDNDEESASASESEHDVGKDNNRENGEDNDALSDTAHDYEEPQAEESREDVEMDTEDDPSARGMAKMLTQCGIDAKTFGWDASKEEWDSIYSHT